MSYLVSPQYGGAQAQIRPSMYETLVQAGFSEEMKTHFVEWFSGDALDSIWTVFADAAGSVAMDDSTDGGVKLTTDTTAADDTIIAFNDINHYSSTGSVCISVVKPSDSTNIVVLTGLIDFDNPASVDDYITGGYSTSSSTAWSLLTKNTTTTQVASSISMDANKYKLKMQLDSSSGKLWMDDVLEAISTTDLPNADLQPHVRVQTKTAAARSINATYLEAYNT